MYRPKRENPLDRFYRLERGETIWKVLVSDQDWKEKFTISLIEYARTAFDGLEIRKIPSDCMIFFETGLMAFMAKIAKENTIHKVERIYENFDSYFTHPHETQLTFYQVLVNYNFASKAKEALRYFAWMHQVGVVCKDIFQNNTADHAQMIHDIGGHSLVLAHTTWTGASLQAGARLASFAFSIWGSKNTGESILQSAQTKSSQLIHQIADCVALLKKGAKDIDDDLKRPMAFLLSLAYHHADDEGDADKIVKIIVDLIKPIGFPNAYGGKIPLEYFLGVAIPFPYCEGLPIEILERKSILLRLQEHISKKNRNSSDLSNSLRMAHRASSQSREVEVIDIISRLACKSSGRLYTRPLEMDLAFFYISFFREMAKNVKFVAKIDSLASDDQLISFLAGLSSETRFLVEFEKSNAYAVVDALIGAESSFQGVVLEPHEKLIEHILLHQFDGEFFFHVKYDDLYYLRLRVTRQSLSLVPTENAKPEELEREWIYFLEILKKMVEPKPLGGSELIQPRIYPYIFYLENGDMKDAEPLLRNLCDQNNSSKIWVIFLRKREGLSDLLVADRCIAGGIMVDGPLTTHCLREKVKESRLADGAANGTTHLMLHQRGTQPKQSPEEREVQNRDPRTAFSSSSSI